MQSDRQERLLRWSPLILGLVAILTVLYFDFGTALPFNDDWVYAWSAQHTDLSGIARFPTATATAFVQAVWGQLATLGHPQEPFLRLAVLPFVLLASACSYRIARNLGADQSWSGVAAIALLTSPIYLNVATSFMSDVPYVALTLAAADAGVRWVRFGKGRGEFLLWAALATLQRQLGVGLPLALTLALLLMWKTRRPRRRDLIWLAASWAVVIGIVLAPVAFDLRTPVEQSMVSFPPLLNFSWFTRGIGFLPAMLGLFLLPFAAGVLFQPREHWVGWRFSWWSLVTLASLLLGAIGVYAAATHLLIGDEFTGKQVFVGDIWSNLGFVYTSAGNKPPVYPDALWLAIGLTATAALVAFFIIRARTWERISRAPAACFLMLAFAVQVGEILTTFVFDRHLLAPAALLVPVLAAIATKSTRQRLALGWAIGSGIVGVALYAVAEQDYQAWQVARDQAVQFAYRYAQPELVYAGYEPTAIYVVVPEFDRIGYLDMPAAERLLASGPEKPRLGVYFAAPDDPRPGVPYDSVAPGKMIVVGPLPADAGSPSGP